MFIKDLACISPQPTFDHSFFEGDVRSFDSNKYLAVEPPYGEVIPRNLLRRMGKAVKMGIWTGMKLIERDPGLEGILIGTGEGSAEDFISFMEQILEYEEGTLTPTAFVQSTPNALAGTLALMSQNTAYNSTYVDKGSAFESALLDALMLFEENEVDSLLVGNMEQYSQDTFNIAALDGEYKEEQVSSTELLRSGTPGTVCGEGCAMFTLGRKKEGAYAEVVDVDQTLTPSKEEFPGRVKAFLQRNGLTPGSIDGLLLGVNGDSRTDHWYYELLERTFPEKAAWAFKPLIGEFPSASALGTWFGTQLLYGEELPENCVLKKASGTPRYLLIYNHHKGVEHGLILLRR
ncbi:MAG: beta-ketoacyl synthase chain length factor [Flavobacteriales bacterium]